MYADPLLETQKLAKLIHQEVKPFIGNFVDRLESDKGTSYINYLIKTEGDINKISTEYSSSKNKKTDTSLNKKSVKMLDYDKEAEVKVAANIMFSHTNKAYDAVLKDVHKLSAKKLSKLIDTYVQNRQGRWHKVGKAFEETYYTFEIISDNGAYKDLQRHRICTQYRQLFTTQLGYEVPKEIIDAGYEKDYRKAMDTAAKTYDRVRNKFPEEAQYISCHGHLLRWTLKINLREAFHICELRSSPQGHPNYRQIAQDIYKLIKEVHPTLGNSMKFVNMEDPGLERLSAEVRKEQKIAALNATKGKK
jgi:thymidylate synthase ThyX